MFTDEPLSPEHLRTLIDAALLSASSRGIRPWEFIVITDRATLAYLSNAKHGAAFLEHAAVGIAVVADTKKSDVWIEDCSIAASNILLAAADLDLGACWVQIRMRDSHDERSAEEYVKSKLDLPAHFAVEAIVAVGHPGEEKVPLHESDLKREKIHYERFSG